jgi:acyl-CoA synthetase (NDP forming)
MQIVQSTWESLLRPASVAMVGASERNDFTLKFIHSMENFGYDGNIYFVNPRRESLFGKACYPTLEAIPETVDTAVISVPAANVPEIIRNGIKKGIRSFVIHTSGFLEASSDGQILQDEIIQMCKEVGAVVIGPNCLGLINVKDRIALYGAPIPDTLPKGNVAVVAQSGSASIVLMNNARDLGFSYIVTTGNEAVLTAEDLIDRFIDDPDTQVIAVFLETLRQPRRFLEVTKRALKQGKPIVAMKVGLSAQGSKVSLGHTGSLAGSAKVFDAVFREYGVIQVFDFDEMVDTIALLSHLKHMPKGSRTAITGISGGELSLVADMADRIGLPLSEFDAGTSDTIRDLMGLPERVPVLNPLDIAAGYRPTNFEEKYYDCLIAIGNDPNVDIIAVSQDAQRGLPAQQLNYYSQIARATAKAASSLEKPVVFFTHLSAGFHPGIAGPLLEADVPMLQGTRTSLQTLKNIGMYVTRRGQSLPESEAPSSVNNPFAAMLSSLPPDKRFLGEREAKSLLAEYGIPVTKEQLATSAEEARAIAAEIGFPVVLKIESPDVIHKSEVGGVKLGLYSEEEVVNAYSDILTSVKQRQPDAAILGVVVQEQIPDGIELIVGINHDEQFGPVVVVGLGGILVEALHQVAVALPPLDDDKARRLLRGFPGHQVLDGYRGQPAADVNAVVDVLLKVVRLAVDSDGLLSELDINPLIVGTDGKSCRVADARIILKSRDEEGDAKRQLVRSVRSSSGISQV